MLPSVRIVMGGNSFSSEKKNALPVRCGKGSLWLRSSGCPHFPAGACLLLGWVGSSSGGLSLDMRSSWWMRGLLGRKTLSNDALLTTIGCILFFSLSLKVILLPDIQWIDFEYLTRNYRDEHIILYFTAPKWPPHTHAAGSKKWPLAPSPVGRVCSSEEVIFTPHGPVPPWSGDTHAHCQSYIDVYNAFILDP